MLENELRDIFLKLNINQGDSVYIASDITRFVLIAMKQFDCKSIEEALDILVGAIEKQVGEQGTILFPMYSWEFCKGKSFHYYRTKSQVGSLNNYVFENRIGYKRTKHPIYSFIVKGKDQKYLCNLDNKDGWGPDSPFAYMEKNNTKFLMIDTTDGRSNTYEHYIEKKIGVPYRYTKEFEGSYCDEYGNETVKIYSMYVRDLDIESTQDTDERLYTDHNLMLQESFYGVQMKSLALADVTDIIEKDLRKSSGGYIYQFKNYVIDWNGPQTHEDDLKTKENNDYE